MRIKNFTINVYEAKYLEGSLICIMFIKQGAALFSVPLTLALILPLNSS